MTENSTPTIRKKRKTLVVLLSSAVVVAGAGAAFAFWTTTGTGTGQAATGAGTTSVTVNQTSPAITNLHPGGLAYKLFGNFTNAGDSEVHVSTVTVKVDSVKTTAGVLATACTSADYEILNGTMTVDADIPAGSTAGSWGAGGLGATIEFKNTNQNQDGCKNMVVHLGYTAG